MMKNTVIPLHSGDNLQEAVTRARTLPGNVTLSLAPGEYFLETPVSLSREDSRLTITSPGKAILTGCKALGPLSWTPYRDGIFRTSLAEVPLNRPVDGVTVNGALQTMARFPNEEKGKIPLGGAAGAETIRQRTAQWQHPETGRIRALHNFGWGGNDYLIAGRDETSPFGLALAWVGDNNRGDKPSLEAAVAENIFEELDAPGEWFYDREEQALYLYPMAETDLKTAEIGLVLSPCLVRMTGESPEKPICGITLENLSFRHTARTLFAVEDPDGAYVNLLRGDWCAARRGAVYGENFRNLSIRDCTFQDMGGNAVFFSGHGMDSTVENCTFKNLGASGIQIAGLPDAVDSPSFWPNSLYPDQPGHKTAVAHPEHVGPVSENYPRDIRIENCVMENIGIFEKQSSGVNLSVSSRIKILHNTIFSSARSCINVNDGSFGGHEIAWNNVFDSQKETTDHGPFNSWGRDRFWSVPKYNASGESGETIRHYTNDGRHFFDTALLDAYQTTRIHHNLFLHQPDAPHSWGIDLDDGSSNYEIDHNLCLGAGIKLREGFERRVHHNIISGGRIEIHVPYAEANDRIYNNLIDDPRPWNFIGVDEERFARSGCRIYGNAYTIVDVTSLPEWVAKTDSGHVAVDPMFRAPEQNDYIPENQALLQALGFDLPLKGTVYGASQGPAAPLFRRPGLSGERQTILWEGAKVTDVDYAVMSATASNGTSGAYFEMVPEGSPAAKLGFCQGDVIKEADGRTIACAADLAGFTGGSARVFRQGEMVDVGSQR